LHANVLCFIVVVISPVARLKLLMGPTGGPVAVGLGDGSPPEAEAFL